MACAVFEDSERLAPELAGAHAAIVKSKKGNEVNADRINELADAALAIAISGHAEIAALRDAALASAAAQEPAQPVAPAEYSDEWLIRRSEVAGADLASRGINPDGTVSPAPVAPDVAKDAERYRWMRGNLTDQVPYCGWWQIAGPERPGRFDAAIDAAIAASGAAHGKGDAHE